MIGLDDSGSDPQFKEVASYDPGPCLQTDERMPSALPDKSGRLWFVGRQNGTVGVVDPKTGKCGSVLLNEEIENSFAVASDGVYIVSDTSMYKFRAGKDLEPKVVWKKKYRNSGVQKPGQFNAGSGTTPTLLWPSGKRRKGTKPGYVAITSEPGVARVDIKADGSGCRKRWTNNTVRAPSVVPKGNSRNGLLYLYENLKDPKVPDSDPWYWTAMNARTGKVAWKQLAGYGGLYNNHYAGIAIGRNPATRKTTLYLGGIGGIMALRDR